MSDEKQLKKMGMVLTLILGSLTALFYFKKIAFMALFFSTLLVLVLFQLLFYPKGLRSTEKVLLGLGNILGWINSRILLSLLFYGVITPIGLCLKLFKKETLKTTIDPKASSYWEDAESQKNPESYKRQF